MFLFIKLLDMLLLVLITIQIDIIFHDKMLLLLKTLMEHCIKNISEAKVVFIFLLFTYFRNLLINSMVRDFVYPPYYKVPNE